MLIKFDEMKDTVLEKFKGGEGTLISKMHTDTNGKIMRGRLLPHSCIGLHTHEGNSEIIFILSGVGKVLYDGEYLPLKPGDCHYCPMGHEHSLINESDEELTFYAIVPEHGVANAISLVSP